MKFFIALFISICWSLTISGQTAISGKITDKDHNPLPGSNIYIEGTLEGTTSGKDGTFKFTTAQRGNQTIIISFTGYVKQKQVVQLEGEPIVINISLKEKPTDLGEVVITAGTFEAGDKKKSAVLSTLDMATGTEGFGDIAGAVASMPGTGIEGAEGGLMVRGGERYETATFIDGLLVSNAFTAQLPTVPVRGRFYPMLFRGTVFSTGGYSAEYGQALSSALILNTVAFPKKPETYFSLNSTGGYFSKSAKWEKSSLASTTTYNNLSPLYEVLKMNRQFAHAPENLNQTLVYRQKIGENGLLKAMGAYNYDRAGLYMPNLDNGENELYEMTNHNAFMMATYNDLLSPEWTIKGGFSAGYDWLKTGLNDTAHLTDLNPAGEFRLSVSGPVHERIKLNTGGSLQCEKLAQKYHSELLGTVYKKKQSGFISALFAEAEIKITRRLLSRIGGRFENIAQSNERYVSPRLSLAFKTTPHSQVNLAYGTFRQQARDKFRIYSPALLSEQAEHFIAGFQITRTSRIFRVEAYHKNYNNLIKYTTQYAINASDYNNSGHGYARGADIFFRDKKTIPNGDFWVSYSLMDSEREYRDFHTLRTPGFISKHTLSATYKHYLAFAASFLSIGYKYASGRPYIDPNRDTDKQQYTKPYSDVSLSLFHFTEIFGKFTMIYAQVNNLLGRKHVFGYRFGSVPDTTGVYPSTPVTSVSRRFFMLGVHISLTGQTHI